ncbi:hypothetical protein C809_00991 [Lachnospiraceae bacterium MD335]|jgi:hypothetical protein|nr:hypothetical protein C809_00991 [Lachnospiraceae bacterium MD335]
MPLERLVEMNGINYNTLLNNTGLYSNRSTSNDVVQQYAAANARNKQTADSRQANADKDTYEHSTVSAKAGYEKPKSTGKYKALDSNGVQEGIKLSDNAKNLLEELRKKYGNMDISVAEWSTDEEQDYYAGLTDKDYSVLINPELLEKMAADDSVREQYESVLGNAGKASETLKEELGEDVDKIKSFSITMDADGKVTYAVKLLKNMAEQSKNNTKTQKERLEEQRAARKEEAKKQEEELETEKIEADSIEGLIAAIKEKLYPTTQTDKITIKDEDLVNSGAANVTA